jgi:type VI secretion system protein ImpJ
MPPREVHWHEGMFLLPHHFQAAEAFAREERRRSEDWYHPFAWGFRTLELDPDAVSDGRLAIRACEARLRDGTKLAVPRDVEVDPLDLKPALARSGDVRVALGVPTWHANRANVAPQPEADGPRYWIETIDSEDENAAAQARPIAVRRLRARLLSGDDDRSGYEVLPLARVVRAAQAEAPPRLDPAYVPPVLTVDAWTPLWQALRALHHQVAASVEQMAAQMIDRGISLESQVPGDAERMLKLAALNGATTWLRATVAVRGITPFAWYQELCRIVGQLAIFTAGRRPPDLPSYDHEDIGGCFREVIRHIRAGLETIAPPAFEKRYFERAGERLQVSLEPGWLTAGHKMFLGVETELSDQECQALLDALDMKMGSSGQVEQFFRQRVRGLRLAPVPRPPRALPAGAGTVYFQVDPDTTAWKDVVDTHTLALRMNLARAAFQSDKVLAVVVPGTQKTTNLLFALYVI